MEVMALVDVCSVAILESIPLAIWAEKTSMEFEQGAKSIKIFN